MIGPVCWCQPDDHPGCAVLLVWKTSTAACVCSNSGPAWALTVLTVFPSARVDVVAVPRGGVPKATPTTTTDAATATSASSSVRRLESNLLICPSPSGAQSTPPACATSVRARPQPSNVRIDTDLFPAQPRMETVAFNAGTSRSG